MYEVNCLDLTTGKEFTKTFEYYDAFTKFIHRCKYSTKIKVISWWKS